MRTLLLRIGVGIAIFLLLLGIAGFAFRRYRNSEPFYLEIQMYEETGDKAVNVVFDGEWQAKIGKKDFFQAQISIDGTEFQYDNYGNYWAAATYSAHRNDTFISRLSFFEFEKKSYYYILLLDQETGENIYYLGPAATREEYDQIIDICLNSADQLKIKKEYSEY